ncbi:toxin-antitoxin system YwqK family antitoxin [Corallococcus carmarthensis]|uniref:Toxin-antitoxin system YwqK family antitoxin n=1 Tax=Corallococcus carmarthensis TaxID=2316728 RepID=A0A3A8JSP9_9BACT|nr:hypothetical protein [Corallococcus carmarthensis]RKG98857.1 hypothetical protein D7X32_28305 [Corallococcus carmarthensis]
MQSKKLMRMFTLGLALASPVAFAGDTTTQLVCPEGTKQSGSKEDGLFCRKPELAGGSFVAHGPYRSFHANGKKAAVGQYLNGLKTGTWFFFDEAGNEYDKIEFRESNYHGTRTLSFASGKPHLIEHYQNGLKDGVFQELSEDGKVVRESRFEKGKEVAAR